MRACTRPKCRPTTSHISGYCSDVCLLLDQDFHAPPVTVLARNKAGGVGTSPHWGDKQPVPVQRLKGAP